jgi:hypothetical protein
MSPPGRRSSTLRRSAAPGPARTHRCEWVRLASRSKRSAAILSTSAHAGRRGDRPARAGAILHESTTSTDSRSRFPERNRPRKQSRRSKFSLSCRRSASPSSAPRPETSVRRERGAGRDRGAPRTDHSPHRRVPEVPHRRGGAPLSSAPRRSCPFGPSSDPNLGTSRTGRLAHLVPF